MVRTIVYVLELEKPRRVGKFGCQVAHASSSQPSDALSGGCGASHVPSAVLDLFFDNHPERHQ